MLLEKACERNLTLATTESCTGGMLASLLTDVQGSAHAFDRGFVTYTEEAKHEMLGLPMEQIEKEGAVSHAVAVAMAFGPAAGLTLVDTLAAEPSLRGYHLLPSVRGDLLIKLGRADEARAELETQ